MSKDDDAMITVGIFEWGYHHSVYKSLKKSQFTTFFGGFKIKSFLVAFLSIFGSNEIISSDFQTL